MATPLLLCVLLCSYYSVALGGNEVNFVVVPTSSSQPEAACSTTTATSEPNRATMPLAHIRGTTKDKPSFSERLRRRNARANYIIGKASGRITTTLSESNGGGVSTPTYLGGFVDSLEYVVTLGIGTPAVQQTVLIDTGSDLSWVQCKPCNSTACYPQKDPLFDPSSSSTYAAVPCGTQACEKLHGDDYGKSCTTNSSGSSLCGFEIKYGDGSTTAGVYSEETVTLKAGVSVNNFSFGCANNQQGLNNKYDGLLGLGGAPESLVSQTASLYGGAFSYCLPSENNTAGFLTLGAPGNNNTAGFLFTPMRRFSVAPTFYVVTLTGISVGGEQLDIPSAALSRGMIIDSGSVVTELPSKAYTALRSAFRNAMSQYPLLPASEDLGLDTCYNFTGYSNVTVPKVALTFNGSVTIDLDVPSGVLVEDCLAFADADIPIGILGNVNQRTFEVLYDSGRGQLGFRAAAC